VLVEQDAGGQLGGLACRVGGQPDHGDAGGRRAVEQLVQGRAGGSAAGRVGLQHGHQMRRVRSRPVGGGGEAGTDLAVEQGRPLRRGLGEQAARHPTLPWCLVAGVRQPLEPLSLIHLPC
jgi:hypothetical protein